MAFAATTVWEVRPDGSNANGIGFDSALGGTDYSQQASPQLTVTDAVGNSTTTVTSVTGGFTAAMVGNGINVNSNLYEITAVTNSNTITVDRATGTFVGQTAKVGGAGGMDGGTNSCLRPYEYGVIAPGNTLWIRATNSSSVATTYTPTISFATINAALTDISGLEFNYIRVEGYSTTRGDGGVAIISTGAGCNWTGNYTVLKNVRLNGTSAAGNKLLVGFSGTTGSVIEGCIFDNSLAAASTNAIEGGHPLLYRRCWFISQASALAGFRDVAGSSRFEYCRFDGGTGALNYSIEAGGPVFESCLFNGGSYCVQVNQNNAYFKARQCIFWGASTNAVDITSTSLHDDQGLVVENCIIGKNTGYDVRHQTDITSNNGAQLWVNSVFRCNWFYTTGTGRYSGLPAASDDQVLTVNPFVSDTTGNFALNSTAGGGAAISGSPCSYAWPDGLNTSTVYAGPYGGSISASSTVTMRSLWRELTNQRDTVVVPDSVVDIYLDWGLQELNRRIRYHYTTASDITLVAGTQEYTMPVDAIEIVWIQYGSNRLLEKGDVEQWRRLGEDWRNEPAGEPRFWSHYSNQFVIRPKPSAEAVATAPTLTVRRKDTPPSITTNGPEQLPTEGYRVVVLYGAYLWSAVYPDSVLAQQRAAALKAEFEASVQAMTESYARRSVSL